MLLPQKLGVLIILFNPTKEDIFNTKKNISCFEYGVIIWNSRKIFTVTNTNFSEIVLKTNLGQAEALNIGFRKAIEMGLDLLLTLDQDSRLIEKGENLKEIIDLNYYRFLNPAGFSFLTMKNEKDYKNKYKNNSPFLILTTITSGTIYLTSVWKKLKGFESELFIEGVDTEYAIRAKKNQFNFYKFDYPILIHDAGVKISKKFFCFNIKIRKHSDVRLYLQYRNNIPIFIKNLIFFPKWSLKSIFNLFIKRSLISILGSKNIFITLFWIFRGTFDGLLELTFFNYKLKKQGQILKNHLKD